MRARITLQQETQTGDGAGGYQLGWQDVATLWAEVEPLRGREVYIADRPESRVTHRMTIRYRSDITHRMRVSHDGRLFNIRAAINADARKRFTQLFVEEGGST